MKGLLRQIVETRKEGAVIRITPILLACLFLGVCYTQAEGSLWDFSGTDKGGTGSAVMGITIVDNIVTVRLDNTSPTMTDDEENYNAPAITAFGVNLDPDNLSLVSWTLNAYEVNSGGTLIGPVMIGSSTTAGLWGLKLDKKFDGVTMEYLEAIKDVKGGLYNPLAVSGLAAEPNYFTTATLVLTFSDADRPMLDGDDDDEQIEPYVRMKNVGLKGDGSLKLDGIEKDEEPPTPAVPEPSALAIWGLGLAAVGFCRRRRA